MSLERRLDRPFEVHDETTAVAFVQWCVATIGLGYHPDTSFQEYVEPDGKRCFSDRDAAELDRMQEVAFSWCDPYETGLQEFAKLRQQKEPKHFHSRDYQERLIREGTREQIIAWLQWNDPNGIYSDRDSEIEEREKLTLEQARALINDQISR